MFTIQDYIDSLNRDKESLVANLTTKGITCSDTETFTELVPKVLDIISVNNQSKSATITSNTTTTITPDEGYTGLSSVSITTNVQVGLSDYFTSTISAGTNNNPGFKDMIKTIPNTTTVSGTSLDYAFEKFKGTSLPLLDTSNVTSMRHMLSYCSNLTSVPLFNTSNVTNVNNMFNLCSSLTSVPQFDTSNVTDMGSMFKSCNALTTIPILNTSKVTNISSFVTSCSSLSDTTLDNILQMCININPNYSESKRLYDMGITNTLTYPDTRIQALPHYNDFITAGWTIR